MIKPAVEEKGSGLLEADRIAGSKSGTRARRAALDGLLLSSHSTEVHNVPGSMVSNSTARPLVPNSISDEFSLRLLQSGLYQLFIRSSCFVYAADSAAPEVGTAIFCVRGDSIHSPESVEVIVRAPHVVSTFEMVNDSLRRLYGEVRGSNGSTFLINATKEDRGCYLRNGSEQGYRAIADEFAVTAAVRAASGQEGQWNLRGVAGSSRVNGERVGHGQFSSFSKLAGQRFYARLDCAASAFRFSASISIRDSRIESVHVSSVVSAPQK